jgi:alpha-N-arabinofuranosidase
MVNVLHSLLLTDGPRCIRTPTYHVFDMMKAHRSKIALRTETRDRALPGLSVSASRQGKEVVLTFVNPKHDSRMNVICSLSGAAPVSAKARLLHDPDFNACNTFEDPDRIVPRDHRVKVSGSGISLELPPLSIAAVTLQLAS